MARWCVKTNKQTECVQRSGYKTAKNCKKLTTRNLNVEESFLMVLMKYGVPIPFSWINFQNGTKDSNIY